MEWPVLLYTSNGSVGQLQFDFGAAMKESWHAASHNAIL
jgi:hypothetical protein